MNTSYYAFHLFSAHFASDAEAEKCVFEQWEPEPPETASNEDYLAWENRNPSWLLADELGFYMDSDFVELSKSANIKYLKSLIKCHMAKKAALLTIPNNHTHLVIIGVNAIMVTVKAPIQTIIFGLLKAPKTLNILASIMLKHNRHMQPTRHPLLPSVISSKRSPWYTGNLHSPHSASFNVVYGLL